MDDTKTIEDPGLMWGTTSLDRSQADLTKINNKRKKIFKSKLRRKKPDKTQDARSYH
jgi:hypothetical protein